MTSPPLLRVLLALVASAPATAAASAALDVAEIPGGHVSLTQHLETLEDPGGTWTLADVRRPDVSSRFRGGHRPAWALEFGYTRSPWWIRVTLRNGGDEPVERLLEVANSRITRIAFHAPDGAGAFRSVDTGSLAPFSSRPYPNRFFVFPVTVPPHGEATCYLRVESSSALLVPASLWTVPAFRAHERSDYARQGWYLGVVCAMAGFNLLLFLALREKLYLQYVILVLAIAFTILSHNGLVKEYVPFDSPLWSLSSASIGYALSVAMALLFMRNMLRTRVILPRIDLLLRVLIGLNLLPIPLALVASHQHAIYPVQFISLLAMVVAMAIGVYLGFRRERSAYFFIVGYLGLIAVAAVQLLVALQALPPFTDIGISAQAGSVVEMLLFALALADRFHQLRLEKERAQQTAAQAQSQLVDTLRSSERVLERRVSERTAELRQFIDMLGHEIMTPMSVIRMCLGMENAPPATRRHATHAVRDVAAIIERCLQADRLEHDALAPRRETCHVDALVADICADSVEPAVIELATSRATEVATDPQLLGVVVTNLVDNAMKYRSPGSTVQVAVGEADRDGAAGVTVTVANVPGAAGVPDPERVFRKYYRSPEAHGRTGSGLGLYLVRGIAEMLGGAVRFHPAEGRVVFELWIPR